MRSVRQFTVIPAVPPALQALTEVARNLHWTWDRETQRLFQQLDPTLWTRTGRDPLRLLAEISETRWAALSTDNAIIEATNAAHRRLRDAIDAPRWFQGRNESALRQIAYFSPEFGIAAALPQYSGGLGILAGDHLKAASDLGVPIIGVGLFYRAGYFRQSLSSDGWQLEQYPLLDPDSMPVTLLRDAEGKAVTVTVTDNLAGTANVKTSAIAYTYQFSEAVTGLTDSDFTPTNGSITSIDMKIEGTVERMIAIGTPSPRGE